MSKQHRPILVTGASGMLGKDVVARLLESGEKVIATDRVSSSDTDLSLDITDCNQVLKFVEAANLKAIVNCAAYTNVDGAESEQEKAFLINAAGVGNIALAAAKTDTKVVQVSTDYVFGITAVRTQPLREEEPCNPQSVYGLSKLYGELLLKQILPKRSLILRTSWLHGLSGPNFIDTMLRLGAERDSVSVVDDQFGSPTWSVWLAEMIDMMLQHEQYGVFHASSKGGISWYDLACEVFKQAGMKTEVKRQSSSELGRPAKRPVYSTLDVTRLEQAIGIDAPNWKDFVKAHLEARGVSQ